MVWMGLQVEEKDQFVSWDWASEVRGSVLLCCPVNLFLLGPGSLCSLLERLKGSSLL